MSDKSLESLKKIRKHCFDLSDEFRKQIDIIKPEKQSIISVLFHTKMHTYRYVVDMIDEELYKLEGCIDR